MVYFSTFTINNQLNVGKYIIHGWYGIVMNEFESNWTLDHPLEEPRSSMVTYFFLVGFVLDGRIIFACLDVHQAYM